MSKIQRHICSNVPSVTFKPLGPNIERRVMAIYIIFHRSETSTDKYRMIQKKVKTFGGLLNKSTWLIFKADMLIYQLKANFYVKTLHTKITHHLDAEAMKMLLRSLFVLEQEFHVFILIHDFMIHLPLKSS